MIPGFPRKRLPGGIEFDVPAQDVADRTIRSTAKDGQQERAKELVVEIRRDSQA